MYSSSSIFVLSSSSDPLSLPPPFFSQLHLRISLFCRFKKNQTSVIVTLCTLTLHRTYLRNKVTYNKKVIIPPPPPHHSRDYLGLL
ncbi:hypothetical protein FKM82_013654 [Ascaphus truei]